MANASQPQSSMIAAIIGIVMLIFGASGVFGQLQDALNTVWEVVPRTDRGFMGLIRDRFLSFTMVFGSGFLLLVSLILNTLLIAVTNFMSGYIGENIIIVQVLNLILSFGMTTFLFGMIYKVLPDVEIQWRDVWIGAIVTTLLFTIGKYLLGFYLGQQSFESTYGAAGSILIILLWVYYSAQILLFGAEFTQVYARRFGSHITPDKDAISLDPQPQAMVQASLSSRPSNQPNQETVQSAQYHYDGYSAGLVTLFLIGLIIGALRKTPDNAL